MTHTPSPQDVEDMKQTDSYFKLIIEDTAIDNFVYAKNQIQWDNNKKDAEDDAYEYLIQSVEDMKNKDIYIPVIENLIRYCITGNDENSAIDLCNKLNGKWSANIDLGLTSIIDTDWDNFSKYVVHIKIVKDFQKIHETEKPIDYTSLIQSCYAKNEEERPFGEFLSSDLQHLILKKKIDTEQKKWNLYQFIIKHTDPVLEYLEQKKDWAN